MNYIQKVIMMTSLILSTSVLADITCTGVGKDILCTRVIDQSDVKSTVVYTSDNRASVQNYPEHAIKPGVRYDNRHYKTCKYYDKGNKQFYYKKCNNNYNNRNKQYHYDGPLHSYPNYPTNAIKDSHLRDFNQRECWLNNGIQVCKYRK